MGVGRFSNIGVGWEGVLLRGQPRLIPRVILSNVVTLGQTKDNCVSPRHQQYCGITVGEW